MGIAVWGEVEPDTEGYVIGEEFDLYWRPNAGSTEFPLVLSLKKGDETWRLNGFSIFEAEYEISDIQPQGFKLHSAYPNPFNSIITFSYSVFEQTDVVLEIFNSGGRLVDKIQNGSLIPGSYQIDWSGEAFPSGVYIARMDTKGYITSQRTNNQIKMLLIR